LGELLLEVDARQSRLLLQISVHDVCYTLTKTSQCTLGITIRPGRPEPRTNIAGLRNLCISRSEGYGL
jgi:hypothetical protein